MSRKTKDVLAKVVVQYMDIYKRFLQENGLQDDSNSIDIESLLNYVDNEIPEDFN